MAHHAPGNTPAEPTIPSGHSWQRLPKLGYVAGGVGLVASVVLAMGNKEQFYYSWLTAYVYFLSIGLGGLFFVLIHHATRAGWAIVLRRLAENIMATLPLFALLFIPIAIGLQDHVLFHHWTDTAAVEADAVLKGKQAYLNVPFFYVRALIYFAAWFLMARWFRARSVEQDSSGSEELSRRMLNRSFPAIAAFALTMSMASWDWIMSHDPHWFSTMFGVYYFAGIGVAIFAFMSILVIVMPRKGLLQDALTVEHQHACGKMTFGFTVFWAYIAFSQFMLIWYANIPEETLWFMHRMEGSWRSISVLLLFGHFAIPFFFLIMRTTKRLPNAMLAGAVWLLLMHYVDLHWQVMPNLLHHGAHYHLLDLTTFVGVGGIWFGGFMTLMTKGNIVPVKDPRLDESLAFQNL